MTDTHLTPSGSRRLLPIMAAALVLLGLVCFISLLIGAGNIGPADALAVLLGQGSDDARFVVGELRLPRTLVGVVVGATLAISGALLQAVTRNPLAEPGLLGVSAGSAFAVALALALGASAATLKVSVAQIGALLGCLCALGAARLRGVGDDPVRLVLAGAALSSLLIALTSLLLLIDLGTADEIRFWIVGSVAGRSLDHLSEIFPSVLLAGVITVLIARPLAALALGERVAVGLGHRPGLVRLLAVLSVALLVGGATAVAGPIAFVGLVVPFVARSLAGPDIRRTLWLCLPLGPLVVVIADILSRVLVQPSELPLGVLTAMIGAPVLVAVVRARRLPTL